MMEHRQASGGSYAAALRRELCLRNAAYAAQHNLAHVSSYGEFPVIVYEPSPEQSRHGNFLPASYRAILARPSWRRRLGKVHTQARACLPKSDNGWRELDSCTSSDALLMNIFCNPSTPRRSQIRTILANAGDDVPEFGFRAGVPVKSGPIDRTEIDMTWGGVLFESKLTETDFQLKAIAEVHRYRDLEAVFDVDALPRVDSRYLSYQLIRNILAAYALEREFCALLDARRPDLIEDCYEIFQAVGRAELRTKCKVVTWQELVAFLSADLRKFLDVKYGVVAPGEIASPAGPTEF